MNVFLGLLLFVIVVLAAFFVVRYVVKLQFPYLGRMSAAFMLTVGTLLDQLNVLPWGQILSETEAKITGFAIVLGMAILHTIETVKKAGEQ